MKILITNDDGINAKGILALVDELKSKHEVYVCAPSGQRSGASHSASYFVHDLYAQEAFIEGVKGAWTVDSTPADCVVCGVNGLIDESVDLVVSGINRGWNTSWDCHYSGTVAGAYEACMRGIDAIAVSLASFEYEDYSAAAKVTSSFIDSLAEKEFVPYKGIWNINIPALPLEEIKGIKHVPFENRQLYTHTSIKEVMDNGEIRLQFDDRPILEKSKNVYGDISAVLDGFVSVSFLNLDWSEKGYEL